MRFEGLLERHERGEPSQAEAAEMLGVSERTFRRWGDRLRDERPGHLRDRRIGKPSSRGPSAQGLTRGGRRPRRSGACWGSTKSALGFTVKHFHEQLQKRHHYKLGYTVTRLALQGGEAGAGRRRGARHTARSGRAGRWWA
jgi:transposase